MDRKALMLLLGLVVLLCVGVAVSAIGKKSQPQVVADPNLQARSACIADAQSRSHVDPYLSGSWLQAQTNACVAEYPSN